ncbi:MAG: BT4734/BF3469 family protein [Rikenellaceae bacterium]
MTQDITIFDKLCNSGDIRVATVADLMDLITTPRGYIREVTLDIQRSSDPERQQSLKKRLPVVVANGIFSRRTADAMCDYGSHLILDFDYKLPLEQSKRDEDWRVLKADPYTRLLFHSPRGGIKLIIAHNSVDFAHHSELYQAAGNYFRGRYGVETDPTCKDIARSHFISFDPEALYNPLSEPFNFIPTTTPQPFTTPLKSVSVRSIGSLKESLNLSAKLFPTHEKAIAKAQEWCDRRFPLCHGFRNPHLFKFAALLHDWGVPYEMALLYLTLRYIEPDFNAEIEGVVRSTYGV